MDVSSLFGGATTHSPGEVATAGAGATIDPTRLQNNHNCMLFKQNNECFKQYECSKQGSTIREAKVLKHQIMTPKVPKCTQIQTVSENTPQLQTVYLPTNQQVSEVTSLNIVEKPGQTVAEPTHYSILGLPIVHLALALNNPTMDPAISERHITNGRIHLSDQQPLLADSAYFSPTGKL